MKNVYKQMKRNGGFTLIELLVVVAIIGILSSVVLASLGGARESARDATRQTGLNQLQTSLELYANQNGEYPQASSYSDLGNTNNFAPGYIQTMPESDFGTGYGYAQGNGQYCVWVELAGSTTPANDTDCGAADGPADGGVVLSLGQYSGS